MKFSKQPIAFVVAGAMASAAGTIAAQTNHDHDQFEEVLVTGELNKSEANTALPINVLSGEALRQEVTTQLGETLQNQVGVHSGTFGAGVGRPIIRGQSGNRVKILQSGVATLDASAVSPDHANGISPLEAQRVEVLRGPSTLLYGNGAIGGVVNVIDNRIPEEAIDDTSVSFAQSYNTVNEQSTSVVSAEGGSGAWAGHVSGSFFDADDTDIPGLARLEDEEEHEEEEHEEGEEHEEEENTDGFIGNSDKDGFNLTLGGSYVGESGFFGLAISRYETEYGLPPGTHGHEEEEDHDEDELAELGEEEHGHEEEEVDVRIDMEQTRYELKGGMELSGFFNSFKAQLAYTDYEHQEIEIELEEHEEEEEHEEGEEEHGHEGTLFTHEGFDSRFTLTHGEADGWQGVMGLQAQVREFATDGEEGYIQPVDITNIGVFVVESVTQDAWVYEFGGRLEQQTTELSSGCDHSETTFSGSASALYQANTENNLYVAASVSQRAATEEELYSNIDSTTCGFFDELVEHAATGRIELGNPDLDTETSQNIEFGWRKHSGQWTGEVNAYYNQVSDYIYAAFTEDEEVITYAQEDATFYGVEAEISAHLLDYDEEHLDFSVFGDYVVGELDVGGDVPRMVPARFGAQLSWVASNWTARIRATEVFEQDNTAANETSTDGYTLVQAYADYHLGGGNYDWVVYLRGNNLLDEEIRDHTSFIKNAAPAAGIGVDIGTRISF
jgi:iron complex outermembrane receptor protein